MTKRLLVCTVLIAAIAAGPLWAGGAAEPDEVTLTIAGRDGAFGDALDIAAAEYSERNPDVQFEILKLSGPELLEQTVIELRGGTGEFDLVMIDDPFLPQMQEAGWLIDLEEMYERHGMELDDDLIDNIVTLGRYPYAEDGTLYALPYVGNVSLFAYREDLANEYGFDDLETWDDALEFARLISENEPDISPVLFRGVAGNPIVTGFMPIFASHGAQVLDEDGRPAFDSPEALEAVEFFLELAQYAPEGVVAYESAQVRDGLLAGTGAMAIEVWPGWIGDMEDPEESEVVGLVNVSAHPRQIEPPAPLLGIWLLGIPVGSQHQDEAFDFLRFITSAEIQEKIARETGQAPTTESVHQISDLVEQYHWYPAQLEALQEGVARPRTDHWAEIESVLGDYLQQALIGDISAEEALDRTQERVLEIME